MSEKSSKQKSEEERAEKELSLTYEGTLISAYKETLHFSNGKIAYRDLVKHPGAVAVIPIDEKGDIIFIKQWRRSTGKILIEIPAGGLEEGESPRDAAGRELQEEIGFQADEIIPLGGFYTTPGFCNEYIHLFVAKNLSHNPIWADDSDYIDLFPLPLQEALKLISEGAFLDSKTLAALSLYQLWLNR